VIEACASGGGVPKPGAPPPPAARTFLPGGLEVRGSKFYKDGKLFNVSGFNYWTGPTLAREGNAAGWDQVQKDLDALQAIGINVVRTMAATEGPDTEPLRIVPTIQPELGKYSEAGVAGVLRFADELQKRGMFGIFMLNDFWHWSGGMAQYLSWVGEGPIPYPPPAPNGNWGKFQWYTGGFYKSDKAKQAFRGYISFLVPKLKDNRAVIWQLANEPRGKTNIPVFREWINDTAGLIRSLAPGQLVSTGSEGQTADAKDSGTDVVEDHKSPNIDFATFHLWVQNWNWLNGKRIPESYPRALERAKGYVNDHANRVATKLGKPILLEEFGFPRDGGSFDPNAPTTFRDKYFDEIYGLVHKLMADTPIAGILPWAWAGEARPPRPGEYWKPGDPMIGDPPHEQQGWYSVYSTDTTVKLIKDWTARITGAGAAPTAFKGVSGPRSPRLGPA
jgi:mannan endo-1,4-beta-mannosidase